MTFDAISVSALVKRLVPKGLKRYYHLLWSMAAIARYGNASKKLIVIGVTGTDGKTTTTTLIHSILRAAGKRVAMLNGLQFVLPSKQWKNKSDNSTPGKGMVHAFLAQAEADGCEYAIIEVTSWGLDQYRLWGIAFDVAVFTNLTYEHLDLHGTMERYKAAKGKLFQQLASAVKPGQRKTAIVNADDEAADYFRSLSPDRTFTFSLRGAADFTADGVKTMPVHFTAVEGTAMRQPVDMHLSGEFNVANALAAAAAARAVGINWPDIAVGLAAVPGVPGRMEFINNGQPFFVIVDFAHTPNGFRVLFQAARDLVGKDHKVIAVYGATGGRDPGRRPMVGEIAAKMVDFSVLTSEDPRYENPEDIAKAIETGLNKFGAQSVKDYTFIQDRTDAIRFAVAMAKPGDAVLLCSMGDYDVMYVGDGKVPWSDREAAKTAIKSLKLGV